MKTKKGNKNKEIQKYLALRIKTFVLFREFLNIFTQNAYIKILINTSMKLTGRYI